MGVGIDSLFYAGNYEAVLSRTRDAKQPRLVAPEIPFVIGALTFLGRLDEATLLFERFRNKLSRQHECVARFFLGIALCRNSHYEKARAHFVANLTIARRYTNPIVRTFAHQGAGFFRFFSGRFANSLRCGRAAFTHAAHADYEYGMFLSTDLMGHSLIQTGEVSLGMKKLKEALRYSRRLGDGETDEGVRISLACYEAEYRDSPEESLKILRKLQQELAPQDTYSQSSLLLEMGRQLSLSGRHRQSQTVLNQACRLIYSSGHRRQGVMLNLRYAYNLFLVGEFHPALNLVRSAGRELDARVDRALALQVLGLELRLQRALGMNEEAQETIEKLRRLTLYTGVGIARRMLRRQGADFSDAHPGEDPLGDLLDRAAKGGDEAIGAILSSGYLGLLYHVLPLRAGESFLYFDLVPDSLLISDRGNLEFCPRGLTQIIKRLIKELFAGECSKEQLIQRVWGYKYDRLRHDSLIYPAISRLRHLLGEQGVWIEVTEGGYRLRTGVNVYSYRRLELARSQEEKIEAAHQPEFAELLNYRQIGILRQFDKREFIDVEMCRRLFNVSKITASRDLSALYKERLVRRHGKGRATRYSAK